MRLWGVWNLLGSIVYAVGLVIGWVFVALVLSVFVPAYIAWTFAALVVCGIVLGVVGNVSRVRDERRQAQIDKELAGMVHTDQKKVQ